jgi:hypothetical protein
MMLQAALSFRQGFIALYRRLEDVGRTLHLSLFTTTVKFSATLSWQKGFLEVLPLRQTSRPV